MSIYLETTLIQYEKGGVYEIQEIKENKNRSIKRTNGNTSVAQNNEQKEKKKEKMCQ